MTIFNSGDQTIQPINMKQAKYLLAGATLVIVAACHTSREAKDGRAAPQNGAVAAATPLAGTYWKLTELNGQLLPADSQFTHEPYLILQYSDSTIKGNGGCNGFGGHFEWKAPNRVSFSRIISTMMACEKIQMENEYFKMLATADSYYVVGDTLILNRARMAPLARFKAVVLK